MFNISSKQGYSIVSNYSDHDSIEAENHDKYSHHKDLNQPNTALMSTILTLGTFLIAHFLRIFFVDYLTIKMLLDYYANLLYEILHM
jgi:hypothetical protein